MNCSHVLEIGAIIDHLFLWECAPARGWAGDCTVEFACAHENPPICPVVLQFQKGSCETVKSSIVMSGKSR
jgi:hypothetical protein